MPNKIDFLQPDVSQIRHQIKNILDSYNHDWDLIAELAQNSVDAIRLMEPVKGHMTLEINAPNKRIVLEDKGYGISPDKLPALWDPPDICQTFSSLLMILSLRLISVENQFLGVNLACFEMSPRMFFGTLLTLLKSTSVGSSIPT